MTTTKHQQLNSLVSQLFDDAERIRKCSGGKNWLSEDDLKNMADAADSIANKIATYRELLK